MECLGAQLVNDEENCEVRVAVWESFRLPGRRPGPFFPGPSGRASGDGQGHGADCDRQALGWARVAGSEETTLTVLSRPPGYRLNKFQPFLPERFALEVVKRRKTAAAKRRGVCPAAP